VTVNLVNGFADRGVDVDLVVSYRSGELLNQVNDAVSLIDLETPKIGIIGATASIPSFVRYLQKETPTVLFSQMHYANIVSILARQIAAQDTKLVLTEHNMFGSVSQQKDRLVFALARQLYPLADHVLCVSSGVAQSVRNEIDLLENQLSVIHNPVVTPALQKKAKASIDHPWLKSTDTDIVLGAGQLIPQKDFPTLLRAVALAIETGQSPRLIILGEGPRQDELERLAADLGINEQVCFPGYVENQYPYMYHADVFALSSQWEGLPTVLIEAMACGTPVVATDCKSGPREILKDGKYGPLVPVGDAKALASALEEVLSAPVSPDFLQERADDFTVDSVLNEYEKLIESLV
jgi:glycosyltransferase involved in cell wall biosynthesis